MKNITMILLVVLIGVLLMAVVPPPLWHVEHLAYMPLVQDDSPDPTATRTPRPPTPTPTATPTPEYTGDGYTWVFIGVAQLLNDRTVGVAGLKPGYCYDVVLHDIQNDGTAVLIAKEIVEGKWWCTAPPYNPDAAWPPPQFAPPTEIPPDIFYGEVFSLIIPRSVKRVCGYGGQTNCVEVRR